MEWSEAARIAAENNGLTLVEFVLLLEVKYRIGFSALELARWTVVEMRHLDLPFTADDYVDAIDSCIEKGVLRILTDADLDDATDVGTSYSFPEFNFKGWKAGAVDFTPRGYEITIKAIYEFRHNGLRPNLVDYLRRIGEEMSCSRLKSPLLIYGTCQQLGRYLLDAADRIAECDDRDLGFLFPIFEKDSPLSYLTELDYVCDSIFAMLQRLTSKPS
ncbi:MAG: hypothetical protein O3A29_03565 [Planctomycetota bacterium]|nr:hypothetical protein [Planctomycetota bacterium]